MSKSMSKINVWRLWRGGKRTGENEKSVDGREERGERRGLGDETGGMSRRKTERKGEGRWQENRVEKRRDEVKIAAWLLWAGKDIMLIYANASGYFWLSVWLCLPMHLNISAAAFIVHVLRSMTAGSGWFTVFLCIYLPTHRHFPTKRCPVHVSYPPLRCFW